MTDADPFPDSLDLETGRTLVSLAREQVERSTRSQNPEIDAAPTATVLDTTVGGVFVTIKRGETLRGCIGRVEEVEAIPQTVAEAAIDAALRDPRCPPVDASELDEITLSTTVLSDPEPVSVDAPAQYLEAIDVGRHGLIVSDETRRGLLLPQVPVDRDWDARTFLSATCQKAGLPESAWRRGDCDIERFTARVFTETSPAGPVRVRRYDAMPANAQRDATTDQALRDELTAQSGDESVTEAADDD